MIDVYETRVFADDCVAGEIGIRNVYSSVPINRKYAIRDATKEEQYRGIDLWLINRETGEEIPTEVKTDRWIHKTGNVACEWESKPGVPGWAQTSQARMLIVFCPINGFFYYLLMPIVKEVAAQGGWETFGTVTEAHGKTWGSWGFKVPLEAFGDGYLGSQKQSDEALVEEIDIEFDDWHRPGRS